MSSPNDLAVRVTAIEQHGTVAIGVGTDLESGATIKFAGDHRPMQVIADAIKEGKEPVADVPAWAVLVVTPRPRFNTRARRAQKRKEPSHGKA